MVSRTNVSARGGLYGDPVALDILSQTVALNTFANATGAAISAQSDGILCSATAGTATQHFGVKFEKTSGTWDLSDKALYMDIEWMDATASAGAGPGFRYSYPSIYLCCDSGTAFTNYARYDNLGSGYDKIPGRQCLMVPPGKITTVAGTFNPAAIKRIEIRFLYQANAVQALTKVKVYGVGHYAQSRNLLCLSFDDQWSSVYTSVLPEFQSRGLVGTVYVQPSLVGTAGRCTWAQLQALADAGWTIGSHAYGHQNLTLPLTLTWSGGVVTATVASSGVVHGFVDGSTKTIVGAYEPEYNGTYAITVTGTNTFTYPQAATPVNTTAHGWPVVNWLSRQQIIDSINLTMSTISANLNGNNIRPELGAYPNGAFSDFVVDAVGATKCKTQRTTDPGGFPGSANFGYISGAVAFNPYRTPGYTIGSSPSSATLLGVVDAGKGFGSALEMYTHDVGVDVSLANYQAFLDGVVARQKQGWLGIVNKADFDSILRLGTPMRRVVTR